MSASQQHMSDWREHTAADGRKYWHNIVTKESTWERPACLQSELERLTALYTAWKIYKAADGREYWHNVETGQSEWTTPAEVEKLRKNTQVTWKKYTNKEEAKHNFMILLRLLSVTPKMRWDEVSQLLRGDSRAGYFDCLPAGEKKQIFVEFSNKLQRELKERDRLRKARAKEAMAEALGQWDKLTPVTNLNDLAAEFKTKWWYKALSDDLRAEVLDEYCDENEEEIYDKMVAKYSTERKKLLSLLIEVGVTNFEAAVQLLMKESTDPRTALKAYEDYLSSYGAENRRKQESEIEQKRDELRRDFKRVIDIAISEKRVNGRSEFVEFAQEIHKNPAYINVVGVPLATPREIYEYTTDDIYKQYEREKAIVKSIFRAHPEYRVTPSTSLEEFEKMLAGEDISYENMVLFYDSLRRRAKRRYEESELDRKKRVKISSA